MSEDFSTRQLVLCLVLTKLLDKSVLPPALASIAKRHLELVTNLIEFAPIEAFKFNKTITGSGLPDK